MAILYDKDGKTYDIPHPVDVKEAMRTGKYFQKDPTKRKVIVPAGKEKKETTVGKKVVEKKGSKIKDIVKPLFGGELTK